MNIITSHEFVLQTTEGRQNNQKIYQDKILTKGPIFSLKNRESAVRYCKEFREGICVLVENSGFFQLWEEYSDAKSPQIDTNIQVSTQIQPSSELSTFLQEPFSEELSEYAKQQLLEYLGPIATIVHKKIITKYPNVTTEKFIYVLAKKIPDKENARKFKKSLVKFVKVHN